jgi:hypothetical protein
MVVNSNWICKPVTDIRFKTVVEEIGKFNMTLGPWIAGGSIRKLWQDIEWRHEDIDIFFRNNHQFNVFVDNANTKKSIIDVFCDINDIHIRPDPRTSKCHFSVQHDTANAKTYSVSIDGMNGNNTFKVQAIRKFFPESAVALINDFDWNVCQFVSDGKHMWASPEAVDGIATNCIVLSKTSTRSIKSLRLIKYLAYGFDVDDNIFIDMLKNLDSTKFRDEVAEDDY